MKKFRIWIEDAERIAFETEVDIACENEIFFDETNTYVKEIESESLSETQVTHVEEV